MKEIKVCSPQLGLSHTSQLGGEVHDAYLIEELCQSGVSLEVCLPKGRDYKKNKNLNVVYLPIKSIVPPYLFNLIVLPYLIYSLKIKQISILRVHSPYFLGLAALLVKKIFPHIKIVTTVHLKEEREDMRLVLARTIFVYDHIFAVSGYLKSWLVQEYKIDPNKITVVYNGVDNNLGPSNKNSSYMKKYNLYKKKVLLNLGSWNRRKNILFLLDVLKEVKKTYKEAVLVLCGSGPLKEEIIKKARELDIKKSIIFIPPVKGGKDKKKLLSLADVFLFPSLNEGFGLVAAEAMVCGKVVIASNNTSLPEVIDRKSGILLKENDLPSWVKETNKVLGNPKKYGLLRRDAYKKVKDNFTWKIVSEKTLKVYRGLLA
jgi:glycosyltransferase involved in cell wall biosynthesis